MTVRILVTNDDGIDSVGLHVLARRLVPLADVVVVAPDREFSGAGASLGALHLIQPEVSRCEIEGVPEAWAVTGPPALCVMFSRLGVFGGSFDLIVSGINPGANAGRAIYHSGTVGACLTARNGGVSSLAVSQAVAGFGVEGQGWDAMLVGQQWETAAEIAAVAVEALLRDPAERAVVVNVNVPNVEIAAIKGWKHAEVAALPPRTLATASLEAKVGHEGAFHVRMDWGDPIELPDHTDSGAVEAGYVAVSMLSRLQHDASLEHGAITAALDAVIGRA